MDRRMQEKWNQIKSGWARRATRTMALLLVAASLLTGNAFAAIGWGTGSDPVTIDPNWQAVGEDGNVVDKNAASSESNTTEKTGGINSFKPSTSTDNGNKSGGLYDIFNGTKKKLEELTGGKTEATTSGESGGASAGTEDNGNTSTTAGSSTTTAGGSQTSAAGTVDDAGLPSAAETVDSTYALVVSTGVLAANSDLANDVQFFRVVYTDYNGADRAHYIFPGEGAYENSIQQAAAVSTPEVNQKLRADLGYYVESWNKQQPFEAYSTDTYLFKPLGNVKSIKSVQMFVRDGGKNANNTDPNANSNRTNKNFTWACQDIRVYRVNELNGLKMSGGISDRYYIDFSGTLMADLDEGNSFSWVGDRMFTFGLTGGNGKLVAKNEPYSTDTAEEMIRMDIADQYGAGIEALANTVKSGILDAGFCEALSMSVQYRDIYGCVNEVAIPVVLSTLEWALEQGVSGTEALAGIFQQGETVAFKANLPDFVEFIGVYLEYGPERARTTAGIEYRGRSTTAVVGDDDYEDIPHNEDGTYQYVPIQYYEFEMSWRGGSDWEYTIVGGPGITEKMTLGQIAADKDFAFYKDDDYGIVAIKGPGIHYPGSSNSYYSRRVSFYSWYDLDGDGVEETPYFVFEENNAKNNAYLIGDTGHFISEKEYLEWEEEYSKYKEYREFYNQFQRGGVSTVSELTAEEKENVRKNTGYDLDIPPTMPTNPCTAKVTSGGSTVTTTATNIVSPNVAVRENNLLHYGDGRTDSRDVSDTLYVTGISTYAAADDPVSVKLENGVLKYTFKGIPSQYYCASTEQGNPVKAESDNGFFKLSAYDGGRPLLPSSSQETYLIELKTDDSAFAATTGKVEMRLSYKDMNGKDRATKDILIADAVKEYNGYWPGVSETFGYELGVSRNGQLRFVISLNNVDYFTGAEFFIRKSSDDWQLSGIQIYRLDSLSARDVEWTSKTVGTQTTDRVYQRSYQGKAMLDAAQSEIKKLILPGGDAQTLAFRSDSTITSTDTDWSEYRYTMPYDKTRTLGDFTKGRQRYTVDVKVGSELATTRENGDCGSKNQFYFQLVFQNGTSGYVLANQQLYADGFRAGQHETFTICTNQDYGELVAVRIIPEDQDSTSDVYDKLNIEKLSVRRQSSGSTSRQWVIEDVGWIGIDYQEEGQENSVAGRPGRPEAEVARYYAVDYSSYVVNLLFAITTANYSTVASTGASQPQFEGEVTGLLTYYDGSGQKKDMTFDMVEAMYAYAGKTAKYADVKTDNNGNIISVGNAVSDPSFMFRGNQKDRFVVSVDDVNQLISLTIKAKNKTGSTIWNIKEVSVSQINTDGELMINKDGEYERTGYDKDRDFLCSQSVASELPYQMALPLDQEQELDVYFTMNTVKSNEAGSAWASVISRTPLSVNDTLNIYVYLAEGADRVDSYSITAAPSFSTTYGESWHSGGVELTPSQDGKMAYTLGMKAQYMSNLTDLTLKGVYATVAGDLEPLVDYAIVQQVRGSVVIDTYYVDFAGKSINTKDGITAEPTSDRTKDERTQVLTLAFGPGTETTALQSELYDVAVSLRYTTIYDPTGKEYESHTVFLTDQEIRDIREGNVVDITFSEPYIKEITGIGLVSVGDVPVTVSAAIVGIYDEMGRSTGRQYSFAEQMELRSTLQVFAPTSDQTEGPGTVRELTMQFTTAKAQGTEESGTDGPVTLTIGYINEEGKSDKLVIDDLRKYISDGSTGFGTGKTVKTRMLVSNVQKLHWLGINAQREENNFLKPTSWYLNEITMQLMPGDKEITRSISERIYGDNTLINLSDISVNVTATAKKSNTKKEAINSTASLLVDSGETVEIDVEVIDSGDGFTAEVQEVNVTAAGTSTRKAEGLSVTGNRITFQPVENTTESNITYYVTIASAEIPSISSTVIVEVKPAPKVTPTPAEE